MPVRKNKEITAPSVRVIGPDGKQHGIVPIKVAIRLARELGMDLIEIAPNAVPPVTRIVDVAKYLREKKPTEPPDYNENGT